MKLYYFSSGPRERVLRAIIEAGHTVLGVFVTDPNAWPKVQPTVDIAKRHDIPLRIVTRETLVEVADLVGRQVCLSVGFAYLFPEQFIQSTKICLNVHGTLLPKYRGARTLNWVIENGDLESGVTVHQIDTGVDSGPILLQRSFPVSIFDTGRSLYRKTLEFEPPVVLEALALYELGKAVFSPQDDAAVVRYPDRLPEHSEIDPALPLQSLYNKIRAADPERFPAYFCVGGEKVCIKMWRQSKASQEADLV